MYHFKAELLRKQDVYTVAMHLERGLTINSERREVSGFVKLDGVRGLLHKIESVVVVKDFSVVSTTDFFEYSL